MEEETAHMTTEKTREIFREVHNAVKEATTKILFDAKYPKEYQFLVAGFLSISCELIVETIRTSLTHFDEGRATLSYVEDLNISKLIRQELT